MTRKDQAATLRAISGGGGGGGGDVVPLEVSRRRLIAVTGGKGGVGKSTTAINLALAYARRGARTLLLDCDLGMADLNLLLGVAPETSVLDVLRGASIEDVVVPAHGIHLLPALNGSYQLANLDEASRQALFEAVIRLGAQFDTLIVDTGAGIDANAVTFAGAAAEVVLVVTSEPLSLADAYSCLKALAIHQSVRRAFVMPNNVRSPSEADEVFVKLKVLADRFLDITLTPLPAVPHDPCVSQAAGLGTPMVLNSPDAPASRAYHRVAKHIDALSSTETRPGGLRAWLQRGLAQ